MPIAPHRRLPALTPAGLVALAALVGCASDPCADYANYMCDCHPEEDCSEYQTIYGSGNADADLQESCAAEMDEAQEEDGAEDYTTTGECAEADTAV